MGAGERRLRILARLTGDEQRGLDTKRLCEVCAEITGMSGAAITLMSGDVATGMVCSSDSVSARMDKLEYELGEGPCVDAYRFDRPVLEPDLADPAVPRWVAFTGPAVAAGVRAAFGFPLRAGSIRLGALNLHRDRPGPLDEEQHADALVMADVAAQTVLLVQASAPPGEIAAELEAGADFRYVVHQAAGMVAVQLGVSIGQALIRLRAHAFGNDRPLTDVARDVVDRALRFDESIDDAGPEHP